MNERDFVYWLQGFFEVAKPTELNAEQTAMVRDHLALVFTVDVGEVPPERALDFVNNVVTRFDEKKMRIC